MAATRGAATSEKPVFYEQVAIVTGGGQGLGLAITQMLADNGAAVVIFDIVEEAVGNELCKKIDGVAFVKVSSNPVKETSCRFLLGRCI